MKKKIIALALSCAMVVSSFSPAFADTAISADAQAVKDLGMLVGGGNGVTSDYLKTAPTRIQAAVMFLRLKGLENAAKAYTGTDNFADANDAAWAKPIMAYLKAHPELGWAGIGGGKFNPNAEIDAKSYYKVMLEALGYKQNTTDVIGDFTFANVLNFAAGKGLIKVSDVLSFTVNDIATATMEALKANVKGGTKTLAVSMVDAKVLDAIKAQAAGLYTAPTVALAVDSVAAKNNKEMVVVFNKEVDKTTAETAGNYVITTTGAATMGTAKLQADKKTVLITLGHEANQQEAITVAVKNVTDVAGNKMATVEKTVSFLDFTIPVAEKVELTGPQQFTITFSEPVNTAIAGSVLVENGVYGATPTISGKTVTVDLGAALVGGSYKVKVAGYKDYAGYAMAPTELTLIYAKDVVSVTAAVKEATQTSVVVEFNKAVKGTLTAANFYHTFTAWAPSSVTDVDGNALVAGNYYNQVKLNFPSNGFPIPAGTTKVVVLRAKDAANEVVDQWGNKMTEDATLSITVASDTTAPTITKVEATKENEIKVTFSEDVLEADAETAANYVIKGADGKVVTPTITNPIVYTSSDRTAVLTLSSGLAGGSYTVEMKDIRDISIAGNKLATTTNTFAVSDKTPATVTATVVETLGNSADEYIYVTYSEAMATTGEGSILDSVNYQLDGKALPSGAKVEMFGTNNKVKITVPDQSGTLVGSNRLTVGKVADLSGNKMVAFSTPITISADVAPFVKSVKSIALNKIEIVVSGILSEVPADGIKVDGKDLDTATTALAAVSFVTNEKNNETTITATLVANENVADAASTVNAVEIVASKIKSITGKYMTANADVFTVDNDPNTAGNQFATNKDGIAPEFVAIADAVAANTFTVSFNEDLVEIASALTATEFVVVDKDGKTLVANVDYTTSITDDVITFTLADDYVGYTGKLTVSTKAAITYFGDNANGAANFQPAADNAAKAFINKEVTIQ